MNHFIGKKNLGILFRKQYKHGGFTDVNIADKITEARFMENAFSHVYVAPLYLYESILHPNTKTDNNKVENFTKDFREDIYKRYSYRSSPEEILGYIFSILHSQTYRDKYSEQLKGDFPRIPFTNDKKIFKKLSTLGNELIQVHLFEKETHFTNGSFMGKGNNFVEKPTYVTEKNNGKLYINRTQYFDNVPKEIFNFVIGGFRALKEYISAREGRELNGGEVDNIEKTIKTIAFTLDQMKKIDNLTRNWI